MIALLPSIVVLGVAACAAAYLALARRLTAEANVRNAAARSLAIATAVQAVHFGEEAATGFPERLGALLGIPSMGSPFFAVFNLTCLFFWSVSVIGLRKSSRAAAGAAWFLAIAGVVNGIAHPLLAAAAGGYFPGLITSPFIAGAAVVLALKLAAGTRA